MGRSEKPLNAQNEKPLTKVVYKPALDWGNEDEAEKFVEMLRLYRQRGISEDEFRRFRLQNGVYSERFQTDYNLVRVKVPAGQASCEQLEKIAELCDSFSIGSAHVSTRECFQLHWVYLDDAPEVLRGLTEVGLTSREACGNTVRNVTLSPFAGVCPFEPFDVTPYANGVVKFFLRNALNQNLPRKFKINFSCCDSHGPARIGDIGVVPQVPATTARGGVERRGFKVFLGGGLALVSYLGELLEDFTPEEDLVATFMAVIRLFDRMGDRERMHRNRMRYLVHDLGFESFRRLVLKERSIVKATLAPSVELELVESHLPPTKESNQRKNLEAADDDAYQRWLFTSIMPQRQHAYFVVKINLPCGDISSRQLLGLSEICKGYSAERAVRLTTDQSIAIRWIMNSDLFEVYQMLKSIGLGNPGANSIASVVGCSGTTSCNLAITNSHRLAKELQARIISLRLDLDRGLKDSTIKVSGCPNSCGQHEIATLGFYGGAVRFNGAQAPVYQMLIGGRAMGSDGSLGKLLMRVPAKKVIEVVLKTLELYRSSRQEGERLDSWVDGVIKNRGPDGIKSLDELRGLLEPIATIPTIDISPDAYVDWGNGEKFRAKTARGECAA